MNIAELRRLKEEIDAEFMRLLDARRPDRYRVEEWEEDTDGNVTREPVRSEDMRWIDEVADEVMRTYDHLPRGTWIALRLLALTDSGLSLEEARAKMHAEVATTRLISEAGGR